ncbi:MAG: DUF4297 domain-containing protein [Chitinophagaceae bacterium]|nr:DUF4297 domain-containing protein [Chitinophagaceae bacterium]MCA6453471.1 DUF4297 domain-containing protein [Chitinophagaceae bacterium]MCA6460431.1 DUF4297 domain-containing protein [Chitinophagaceae bacterium]MCA6465318.1 DUF4297 domain-containing protein [Chitinophagaceae bacterium]
MKLTELIATSKPREISGSRTSKQYDYQKDLSLMLMIGRHAKGQDYIFVFDYHDDLLILNREAEPDKIDFIQIKTTSKQYWNIGPLITAGPGELSILGKLYLNKILFKDFVQSLQLHSNQPFKFKLGKNLDTLAESEIKCTSLTPKDLDTINKKLQNEHGLSADAQFKDILFFERSKLSLDDSATHCAGALGVLFQQLNPTNTVNAQLAYQKIFNEVRIKTAARIPGSETVNWELIKERKGISRSEFDQFLKLAGVYKSLESTWEETAAALTASGMGYLSVQKIKSSWRTVQATILSQANNLPLHQTIAYVNQVIDAVKKDPTASTLNLVGLLHQVILKCDQLPTDAFDSSFIEALVLRQLSHE